MPIDYERLMHWKIPEVEQRLTRRDTILYALGVGLGADPMDENQLRFVLEDGLQALPTMGAVLAHPGFWLKHPETGVDWVKVVHIEQQLILHQPLPVEASLLGVSRIVDIFDRGPKGAQLVQERKVYDQQSGDLLCTNIQTALCRADGHFGGPPEPQRIRPVIPAAAPHWQIFLPTLSQAALIYRLNGDYNPLHADPKVAQSAGFVRPILHGLCTFGVAGHALLKACCDYDPARLKSVSVRFSSPLYPGETVRTDIWTSGSVVTFRATAVERNQVVLDHGHAELA